MVVVRIVYGFPALLDSRKSSAFEGVRVAVIGRGNKRIVCVIRYNLISDFHEFVFDNAVVFKHGVDDFGYVAVCIVFIRGVAVFDKESPAVILIRMIAEQTVRNADRLGDSFSDKDYKKGGVVLKNKPTFSALKIVSNQIDISPNIFSVYYDMCFIFSNIIFNEQ